MVKMAVRGISRPHFQMTVVKIQVHFQNEGAVYQHNIWKQSGMPGIIMAIFGKGHVHLTAYNSNIIPKVFSLAFFPLFFSCAPVLAVS